ncbi:carbohydrate ABC transporter permease [Jiangella asiatica]|uniref:Carbohydrate ABC transporter permease n=1 Tax=Jiangella asiatica TaxID=2530372 RepID=A0A4V6PFL0_9ACTN|nr:carbohydrate ABC transporter permease [Jiangella asiatica]TDE08008.1 carbohydrate ABC transporter permease [Jiangella asiatica]
MIGRRTGLASKAFVLGLLVVYAIPLAWIALTALKSEELARAEPNTIFFRPTLETFRHTLEVASESVATSIKIAVAVTVLVLAVAVPAAYALARKVSARWSRTVAVLLGALLVLQMVPQPMAVIPLYQILAGWGLVDTLPGLILADTANLVPFAILLLRPFVLAIPGEIYEAAQVDGASGRRTFRSIVIPLLPNGIATVATIVFIMTWGEFVYATTLITNQQGLPVSGLLAQQTSMYSVEWSRLMGLSLLTSLPLLVVFLIAKRRLVAGLSLGAVR